MGAEKTLEQILAEEGIANFEQDLRQMSKEELLKHFAFESSGQLNATRLIKNLVWQAYTWIRDGKRAPTEGNLRSFWYTDVKPVLSRVGLPVEGRRLTELVYDVFVEMVTKHHLFSYRDFGFLDEGAHVRAVGRTNGALILFAEKEGRFELVREIARGYDATGLALGGYPSSLSTEYLLFALREKGALDGSKPPGGQAVHLFSVVDYDPSGYWIEREFAEQIQSLGVGEVILHTLVHPKRLSPERVQLSRYELKKDAKTANWLKETGGIGGEAYGLEADAFTKADIGAAFLQEATPYLKKPGPAEIPQGWEGLLNLLGNEALRRLKALSIEEVVERIAGMSPGELLELERRLRERLAREPKKA